MQEDTGEQLLDPQEETADQVAQRLRDAQTIIIGVLPVIPPLRCVAERCMRFLTRDARILQLPAMA